ncbi:MAG TPA: hypothetical protein PKD85_06870 [Saprospiraceae bacterium]|nr:hypothetical protein [Saprospiraceae bacterium]
MALENINNKLEQLSIEPSSNVWERIETNLKEERPKIVNINFKVATVAALFALVLSISYLAFTTESYIVEFVDSSTSNEDQLEFYNIENSTELLMAYQGKLN